MLFRQPSNTPVIRHASSMTSLRHQSPVNDVTAESRGAPDDVIFSDDDDDQPLERDIVRRRIDLFEKQVSRSAVRC